MSLTAASRAALLHSPPRPKPSSRVLQALDAHALIIGLAGGTSQELEGKEEEEPLTYGQSEQSTKGKAEAAVESRRIHPLLLNVKNSEPFPPCAGAPNAIAIPRAFTESDTSSSRSGVFNITGSSNQEPQRGCSLSAESFDVGPSPKGRKPANRAPRLTRKAAPDDQGRLPLKTRRVRTRPPVSEVASTFGPSMQPANSSSFPVYSYRAPPSGAGVPTVVYTRCEEEADELVEGITGPIGFDMEWCVNWRSTAARTGGTGPRAKMYERRTALVQVADKTKGIVLLIQISAMGRFPKNLQRLMEDPKVAKLGANIYNDAQKLHRDFGIVSAGLVELGAVAKEVDPRYAFYARRGVPPEPGSSEHAGEETSGGYAAKSPKLRTIVALAKLVAHYTGRELLKDKERISNWEAELTAGQIEYAVNDAHCALAVYDALLTMAARQGRTVDVRALGQTFQSPNRDLTRTSSAPATASIPPNIVRSASEGHSRVAEGGTGNVHSRLAASGPRPGIPKQHWRAYVLWHHERKPLSEMCASLRVDGGTAPLKPGTVITYVIGALNSDASLPFSMERLKELVQMDASSWTRHREWIEQAEGRAH